MLIEIINYFDKTLIKVLLVSKWVTWVEGWCQCASPGSPWGSLLAAQWWRCKPLFILVLLASAEVRSQSKCRMLNSILILNGRSWAHALSLCGLPTHYSSLLPHPLKQQTNKQINKHPAPKTEWQNPSDFPLLSELILAVKVGPLVKNEIYVWRFWLALCTKLGMSSYLFTACEKLHKV